MFFKPQNFRKLDGESKPQFKIRNADYTTLILVKGSGEAMYGRTRGEKDDLIEKFEEGSDLLLWAWTRQHHTDVFVLSSRDVQNYYK